MAPASQSKLIPYIVLRAIAIGGERIEPGSLVDLGTVLGAELAAANKVRRATEADLTQDQADAPAAPDPALQKPVEPTPEVRRRAKPRPADEVPQAQAQAPLLATESTADEAAPVDGAAHDASADANASDTPAA